MRLRNQNQSSSLYKRIGIALFFFVMFFLAGTAYLNKASFAVTYNNSSIESSTQIKQVYEPSGEVTPMPRQQKARAPEPSGIILVLCGLTGMVVRFVRRSFQRVKRLFDIGFSVIGLALATPLLLVCGLLIKLTSKGPIVYRQDRVGIGGEVFKIYKLRTMCIDAESNTGAVWARKDDPRITPLGRIFRKLHIDEVPQLLNVLKGQMSIVGPRPERPELVRDLKVLIADYQKRLAVKPGITGLAQVWHKYDETIEDVKKKVKYDLLYIRSMCLMVDLRILANTVTVVLTGKGAR